MLFTREIISWGSKPTCNLCFSLEKLLLRVLNQPEICGIHYRNHFSGFKTNLQSVPSTTEIISRGSKRTCYLCFSLEKLFLGVQNQPAICAFHYRNYFLGFKTNLQSVPFTTEIISRGSKPTCYLCFSQQTLYQGVQNQPAICAAIHYRNNSWGFKTNLKSVPFTTETISGGSKPTCNLWYLLWKFKTDLQYGLWGFENNLKSVQFTLNWFLPYPPSLQGVLGGKLNCK